jgi:hypothetical protein
MLLVSAALPLALLALSEGRGLGHGGCGPNSARLDGCGSVSPFLPNPTPTPPAPVPQAVRVALFNYLSTVPIHCWIETLLVVFILYVLGCKRTYNPLKR